ncbi:glutamate synthase-related protein [Bacillus suaedaesalsae]|uniref:Glutamate synthase n=1 Tax=Bacillus suaedaesalsae TaxID=2810349 RepID=A0ABS2DDD2_9BACI|nr:glutamate synthase-related protein [Bacillus suaedaesalsae]MBM6616443.1 glutamate synthase [Bacillus suaedaesalsae]
MKTKWNPSSFKNYHLHEHDACGIVSVIEKQKVPTKENIELCISALVKMNHRAGFTNGEGDGVGIHIDIPKELWKDKLSKNGIDAAVVHDEQFIVGHFFMDKKTDQLKAKETIQKLFKDANLSLLFQADNVTNSYALGPIASAQEPSFWQVALLPNEKVDNLERLLFELTIKIEENNFLHVSSLSNHHAVYKVMGAGDILPKYYQDLSSPLVASTMTLGHNRYSTNTLSNFFRVQPFSVLGHNGEINTIAKFRDEAEMIGVPLTKDGSDSQDINRMIETLLARHGFTLFEALDIIFPPIINEIKAYPEHLQDLYTYVRESWGHFSQGPAGIISRYKDEAVFSLDSLGLRPLWQLETTDSYLFSSEPGIVPSSEYTNDPKPLAPGEKVGLKYIDDVIKLYSYESYQEEVYTRIREKLDFKNYRTRLETPNLEKNISVSTISTVHNTQYSAFGWDREHIQLIEQMADKGAEPIRSLGHDAPLAAIDTGRRNLADFIKESVAVVTNPAIDRDRETEHFSTRTMLGKRPSLFSKERQQLFVELSSPILVEGNHGFALSEKVLQPSYDQVVHTFHKEGLTYYLDVTFKKDETVKDALTRLSIEALEAVQSGKTLLVLEDSSSHQHEKLWLDPLLVVSTIDQHLIDNQVRRDTSILLRSGAIRSLHDLILSFGLGADAISPYLLFATVSAEELAPIQNLFESLNKGLEKVISTLGIHELRGYGRLFSSIGLNEEVATALRIVNFLGSESLSFNFDYLKQDALERLEDFANDSIRPGKTFHIFPRVWKAIGDVAKTGSYDEYRKKMNEQEDATPITIRHLTNFKQSAKTINPDKVDLSVGAHSLPFVISSMSFGSQNEIAFRAYAEAAERLNMISLNGEGGEIKDMLGKYPNTRGQQVASGRFGVNAELLNSSNLLEIKIGQGAKPGEGGHLPGSKVTKKIAEARNATIGSDLISPSNNHDIYSIEDLAQMITELKTANDQAKVSVKVPVVPNIGTIAVGIAKAGADIITISGFDGGTGAARIHALQHVGLPVEIGVKAAHNALLEAGIRNNVEIWADGGIKSASDVVKIMLLGANRIGFGTLSMIAIGCTTCRGCHLDTCHVGIATQIESESQAKEHGLRRFVPRQLDLAVQGLTNLFTAFGAELKEISASLGFTNLQDIVGRSDLLEQTKGQNQLNLNELLKVLEVDQFTQKEVTLSARESHLAVAVGAEYLDHNVSELTQSREFSSVTSEQRVLGSRVSCHRVRGRLDGSYKKLPKISLHYKDGSIPGNGLGAYNSEGIDIRVEGGSQDGIGKTSFGGNIYIVKAKGKDGKYYNGSVGKGFGYGAQKGQLFVQGSADARAGIRLSGADMIIGGRVTTPVREKEYGNVGVQANIKGFAFEYMTNGRGLVLGDPGPWICAGMTGGAVYLRHDPTVGLTKEKLTSRLAKGAKVTITSLSKKGLEDVVDLLTSYVQVLKDHEQWEEVSYIEGLLQHPEEHFLQVVPVKEQADPAVSTE